MCDLYERLRAMRVYFCVDHLSVQSFDSRLVFDEKTFIAGHFGVILFDSSLFSSHLVFW